MIAATDLYLTAEGETVAADKDGTPPSDAAFLVCRAGEAIPEESAGTKVVFGSPPEDKARKQTTRKKSTKK
jgi:hypothetical protein